MRMINLFDQLEKLKADSVVNLNWNYKFRFQVENNHANGFSITHWICTRVLSE